MIIATFPYGTLETYDDNETTHNSTIKDPCKMRMSVDIDKVESNLGAFSVNLRRPDNRQEEMAYIMGRLTANKQGGAFYIACRPDANSGTREVFYIDNGQAIFRVPVYAPNLGSGGGVTDKMVSNNGRFVTVQQGDGNFVTYDLTLGPEGDPNAAIWSAWSGKIER